MCIVSFKNIKMFRSSKILSLLYVTGTSLLVLVLSLFLFSSCEYFRKRKQEKIMSKGAELFVQYACLTCHSVDGQIVYGPPLNDIYMQETEVIRNNEQHTVEVNREYLRKAIADPRYEKVLGYTNKEMPLTFLSDEEVAILVEYIVLLSRESVENQEADN